ncbi:MAG: acyl-CoA acyltransferase [Campylobacterota bacterium]|nr:acyl-CoA acyltransferase [Campylobacterota bacterium]
MAIKIRKAVDTDAELIAWAIMVSSRSGKSVGLFDLLFRPKDDAELLERLKALTITQTKCYCHFTNFLIAELDGESIGLLCGYEPRIATHEIFSKALAELGCKEEYKERISAYTLCEPEIDRQTWVLDFMVERPGYDSFEVLKELMQKSLLTARLKGYRKAQTMVEIGSIEAQMVYEKLGFLFEDEKRADYYQEVFGRPGIKRLHLSL